MWQLWPHATNVTTCDNSDHIWQLWPHATFVTTCDKREKRNYVSKKVIFKSWRGCVWHRGVIACPNAPQSWHVTRFGTNKVTTTVVVTFAGKEICFSLLQGEGVKYHKNVANIIYGVPPGGRRADGRMVRCDTERCMRRKVPSLVARPSPALLSPLCPNPAYFPKVGIDNRRGASQGQRKVSVLFDISQAK